MPKEKPVEFQERVYTIPLRKAWMKVPSGKRAGRTVNEIRRFLYRHMKVQEVKTSQKLNELLWKRGDGRPPASVKVKIGMEKDTIIARLPDELVIKEEKKDKGRLEGLKERAKSMRGGKPVSGAAEPEKPGRKQEKAKPDDETAEKQQEDQKPEKKKTPEKDKPVVKAEYIGDAGNLKEEALDRAINKDDRKFPIKPKKD